MIASSLATTSPYHSKTDSMGRQVRRRRDGHGPPSLLTTQRSGLSLTRDVDVLPVFFRLGRRRILPMVIRKHDEADLRPIPPIPTQVVRNGEFVPLPKTQKQRGGDLRLRGNADGYGPPRGLSRRRFPMTATGLAAARLALN